MPTGVVWLVQDVDLDGTPGGFYGIWETAADGAEESRLLGERDFTVLSDAMQWAQERARVIIVKLCDSDHFSAGRDAPPWQPDMPRLPKTA